MDVFNLAAKIVLDTSEYESGIARAKKSMNENSSDVNKLSKEYQKQGTTMANSMGKAYKDIDKSQKETANNSEGASQKFSKNWTDATEKLGKAATNIGKGFATFAKIGATAIAAGAAGVAAITKMSVESYAEYEQLVGGVETLFKTSQDVVMKYAENAYKTAGLSANAYMETVTSFSASLIQSLGGDTAKAAEVADMAITDMSDNANKMGTSMELLQNAYNGFAKGNFTMLDNLKLGYGGTQEEMKRLLADAEKLSGVKYDISSFADISEAIHVMQVNMGIAGTTAKEAASTISGSIGMMKASWTNLVTAISDENADFGGYVNNFVDSIAAVAENLIPRISVALGGVVQLIDQLAPVAIAKIPELFSSLLPAVLSAAEGLIHSVNAILPGLIDLIVNTALPQFLDGLLAVNISLLEALPSVIGSIASALPSLVEQLLVGTIALTVALCEQLPSIIEPLIAALPGLLTTVLTALLSNLDILLKALIDLTAALIPMLPEIVNILIFAILETFTQQWVSALLELLPVLVVGAVDLIVALCKALPDFLLGLVALILGPFYGLFNAIKTLVTEVWEWAKGFLAPVGQWVYDNVIQPVAEFFSGLWSGIVKSYHTVIDPWMEIFKKVAAVVDEKIVTPIKNYFTNLWTTITTRASEAWEGIKSVFTPVVEWFSNVFSKAWQKVKDVFSTGGKVFDGIKEGIASVFKTVVNAIIGGINKVIKVPFNAINNALARIRDVEIMGIKPFDWVTTFNVPEIPKLSTGLQYVPFDGYPAILHRGEAVLTAAQASVWRNGQMQPAMAGGITINQYIQSVPQTPVELAATAEAYFQQARWKL